MRGLFSFLTAIYMSISGFFGHPQIKSNTPTPVINKPLTISEIRSKLTPQIRQCIFNKLGKQEAKGLLEEAKETKEIPKEALPAIQSCLPEGTTNKVSPPQTNGPMTITSGVSLGAGVQPETLRQTCDVIQQYGSKYQWFTINWSEVEPAKGKWNFARIDKWVDGYRSCGQEVATHVDSNAEWAIVPSPSGTKTRGNPPKNYQDYYDFMFNLATHFKGRISRYSIENEAHAEQNWSGTPEEYIKLLQTAYKAIKAADPNALIEDPGMSFEGWGYLTANWLYNQGKIQEAIDFANSYATKYHPDRAKVVENATQLQEILQKPGVVFTVKWEDLIFQNHDYLDRIQVHYYGPWQDLPIVTDFIHEKLTAVGAKDMPLDFFEMGYGWQGAPGNGYDPQAHARDLPKLLTLALAGGADRLVDYRLNCATDKIGQPGLFGCDEKPRPAATSFKIASQKLTGATSVQRLSLGNNNYGYKFSKNGKDVYVLWSTTNSTVSLPITGTVTITDITGATSNQNAVSLSVSQSPIFVE